MMALNYDFDMLSPTRGPVPGDAADMDQKGGVPVALFRDPETVDALSRAPQPVQDFLRASHFGINCYDSGAPRGRYPEADDGARIEVIEALAANVGRFALPRSDDSQPVPGEFHLPSFFAAVAEAEPIVMPSPLATAAVEPDEEARIADSDVAVPAADSHQAADKAPASTIDDARTEVEPIAILAVEAADATEAMAVEFQPELSVAGADLSGDDPDAAPVAGFAEAVADETAPVLTSTDTFISMMLEAEEAAAIAAPVATEAEADVAEAPTEAIRFPILLLENPIFAEATPGETDVLIAGMMAGTDEEATPEAAPNETAVLSAPEAEAEVPSPAVIAGRRFRLPHLPRWLTAAAAFVAVGVAVGSTMI